MEEMERTQEEKPEELKSGNKKKERKGIWLPSLASGIAGSLITGSLLVFGGDYLNSQDTVPQKEQAAAAGTAEVKQQAPLQQTSYKAGGNLADMVETSSKSIVGVVNYQLQRGMGGLRSSGTDSSAEVESGTGSGVMYKKDGKSAYIVTNNHVIEGASKVEVTLEDGSTVKADVVGADALTDLAVLKIGADNAPEALPFGDSDAVRAGESVVAIGNPLGLEFSRTVTQGIVSAADRSIEVSTSAGEWDLDVIQTDAAINPGNSGGALINEKGEVIGINSLKISEDGVEGLGFAIPSNDLKPIVEEMIRTGKVSRPYLGVSLSGIAELPGYYQQNIPDKAEEGVMVTSVENGSPAAKAGLQQQDIITAIDGNKVTSTSELRKYLYKNGKSGKTVALTVYRGQDEKTINVQPDQS